MACACLLGLASLSAQSTVFVTRHCDRLGFEPDPPLSADGESQAEELAAILADANIRHIYSTDTLRTRQTAAPTARVSGVIPVILPQSDLNGMAERVKRTLRDGESTLVVVHKESLRRMVKALSGAEVEKVRFDEYSRLVAITIFPDGRISVVTLRRPLNWPRGKAVPEKSAPSANSVPEKK